MDRFIQVGTVVAMLITNIVVYVKTRRWGNPVFIISVMFFFPLAFSLSRLSGLQSLSWHGDTYLLAGEAILVWLCLPALAALLAGRRLPFDLAESQTAAYARTFAVLVRIFAVVVFVSYLAANRMQGGTFFPMVDAELSDWLHVEFPQGLRILVRMTPAAVGLVFMAYYFTRRRVDLLILLACFLVPLSRLSRIDVAMSLVVLIVLNGCFPIVRVTRRRLVVLGASLALVVLGLSYVGSLRMTAFGRYDQTFARVIDFQGYAGPSDVLAYLYLAFPLSFENLDRFVAERAGQHSYGLGSFTWVFSGLLKLNLLMPDYTDIISTDFDPVATGANVPTALAVFFLDFGASGAWIPMVVYMAMWWWLFSKSNGSPLFTVLYALTSAAFALASLQAIMVHGLLFYQLFAVAAVFLASRYLSRLMRTVPQPGALSATGID